MPCSRALKVADVNDTGRVATEMLHHASIAAELTGARRGACDRTSQARGATRRPPAWDASLPRPRRPTGSLPLWAAARVDDAGRSCAGALPIGSEERWAGGGE